MSPNDQPLPDIAFHLDQLGETTTAAELVRKKGQSKKLKVISEKKLMDWILALLQQQLAGKADAFSDEEKQELIAKAQAEIAKRMKLEQELESARERKAAEVSAAHDTLERSKKTQEDYEAAIAAYKSQLEQRDHTIEDLQQDNFDLNDQLSQQIALLRATIEEKDRDKDKLQSTLRSQMVRSTTLLEGVLGLDQTYYGGRHAEQNPVPEDAPNEEQFFHDFDIGAAVIQSLAKDLERLREIAKSTGGSDGQLLESDLALLTQLKDGSLAAMDVAEPVAALVEAIEGVRDEASALEEATALAIGINHQPSPVTAVPDAEGKPAEVLAGATTVVRELGALLARERNRLVAIKSMADEADAARNAGEIELEALRVAYDDLVKSVSAKAAERNVSVPKILGDARVDPAKRIHAVQQLVDQIVDAGISRKQRAEAQVIETKLAEQIRDVGIALGGGKGPMAKSVKALDQALDKAKQDPDESPTALLAATQQTVAAMKEALGQRETDLNEAQTALASAKQAQNQLASQLRDLGKSVFADTPGTAPGGTQSFAAGVTKVHALDQALADGDAAASVLSSAREVVEALRKDVGKKQEKLKAARADVERAQGEARALHDKLDKANAELATARTRADELARSERDLSLELVEAAKGDAHLADAAADLALVLDDNQATGADLSAHSKLAVAQLAKRKKDLDAEIAKLRAQQDDALRNAGARNQGLEKELAQLTAQTQDLAGRLAQAESRAKAGAAAMAEQGEQAKETAETAKEIIHQLKEQVDARGAEMTALREQDRALQAEAATLREQLIEAEAANRALAESLSGLSRAVGDDVGARGARGALEQALSELPGEADVPLKPEVAGRLAAAGASLIQRLESRQAEAREELESSRARMANADVRVAEIAERAASAETEVEALKTMLAEHEGEMKETAETAKEAIQQLRDQITGRDEKLKELRRSEEQLKGSLADARSRLERSDLASRKLAETLSQLAAAELETAKDLGHLEAVEEARVDLETTLSELPEEGEAGVDIPADLGLRLAESGRKAAEAVTARRRTVAQDIERAQGTAKEQSTRLQAASSELQAARTELGSTSGALKRAEAELAATRNELKEASTTLAGKVQALAESRSKIASLQADLDSAMTKGREFETAHAESAKAAQAAQSQLENVAREREQTQARAATAEGAQAQLTKALRAATQHDDPAVTRLVADPGSALGRAAQRLAASEPAQQAAASRDFAVALRERLAELAGELVKARERLAANDAEAGNYQQVLSATKASLVSREQELGQLRAEAEAAQARAQQAETAAREVLAAAREIGDGEAAQAIDRALAGQTLDAKAVQGGTQALRAIGAQARGGRERLGQVEKALGEAERERDGLRTRLGENERQLAELDQRHRELQAAEKQLASAAAELSRELLTAAKAMAADGAPDVAERVAKDLAGLDRMAPAQRVAAAAGAMPTVRELFTTQALAVAELHAKGDADRELHAREVQGLRQQVEQEQAHVEQINGEATKSQEERAQVLSQLMDARKEIDALAGQLKMTKEELLQASAELDEFHARGAEATGGMGGENTRLSKELAGERQAKDRIEAELASLRERVKATEARLAKQREESVKLFEERDLTISEKTRQIDQLQGDRADTRALTAKVEALSKELAAAQDEINSTKGVHGDRAGFAAQAGDLANNLKSIKTERDQMRARMRETETELAETKGELEEVKAAVGGLRQEMDGLRAKKDKEVEAAREKETAARDEARKLKEENVGLKARVRRLTEH